MSSHAAPAQDGLDHTGGANPGALWDGDPGSLPRDTRRTLVRLLQGPYLTTELHPELWNALLKDEADIRRRLGDLFLELVIDRAAGLAFTRNASDPTGAAPSVMRAMRLTLVDTVLLLHLRTLLLRANTPGERVFVDRSEIDDHLSVYRPHTSTDHTGFMRRVSSSVDKLKRAALLRDTDVAERYEVSPVLALVFTADEVAAVTAEYRRLLGEDGRDSSDSSGGSESNGAPEGGLLGGGAPADAGKGGAPAGAPAEERPASPEAASDPVANSSEERDES
ncbi:DUF4194 domain-containing protein [Actinomyces massiliensis]|uniref:DUF4194 domain-containing protein n=1 Tax=Actinomyces massiliensis TaxID=461393 RepID=UPI0028EDF1C0|nr:DUF4194 domain-containing protein [Actinomyces massiliensis]